MKNKISLAIAVLALVAGPALAAPADIDLGTGPGAYDFSGYNVGQSDSSFFVTLGPGTYDFTGSVGSESTKLLDVWLSFSDDKLYKPGTNDLTEFDKVTGSHKYEWQLGTPFELTLTQTTNIYLNVDAKTSRQWFAGNLDIVSAPVPEPASGALLVAGLGALGFIGRRRRG